MEAKAKLEKPIEDALMKLKIDSPSKARTINVSGPKGASQSDSTSCISSADATSSIKESEVDQEACMGDQGMYYCDYYYGYYYPGSTGSTGYSGDWENHCCNIGMNNSQNENHATQVDNGSVVYYLPGFHPGFSTYSPFLPAAIYGVDGQYMGQGPYYPGPLSQTVASPGFCQPSAAFAPELVPTYAWDPSLFFLDEIQGRTFTADPTNPVCKPKFSSHGHNLAPSISTTSKGSSIASDVSRHTAGHNPMQNPVKKVAAAVLSKGYVPVNKYNAYSSQGKGALFYPSSAIVMKENGQGWVDDENLKVRTKLNTLGDLALLNEQNRGPRTNGSKTTCQSNEKGHASTLSGEKNDNETRPIALINKDDYNRPDFQIKYEHASFFIIKSYSEDDIHKSIKYNVWASTPNGNKRLDSAFQVAQEKMSEKGCTCPVFLFFSVNASGQFCGVAEMTGRVDFSKKMEFWQQDKWNGYFPVKWHIIKDVPNPQLRHIILENNDNKPVTNSRDTQEVKFSQGTEMLSIFKNYSSKTSILDDFGFYENRQKAMQEKRKKPTNPSLDHSLAKHVDSSQVQKPGDSKLQSPNLASVELKENLQPGIPARK